MKKRKCILIPFPKTEILLFNEMDDKKSPYSTRWDRRQILHQTILSWIMTRKKKGFKIFILPHSHCSNPQPYLKKILKDLYKVSSGLGFVLIKEKAPVPFQIQNPFAGLQFQEGKVISRD